MVAPEEDWRTAEADELLDAIVDLRDREEAARFLRDLCTLGELHDLAQRWHVVRLLAEGLHYGEVSRLTGASTATVTRIAQWLHHGTGGYGRALQRRATRRGEPLTPRASGPAAGVADGSEGGADVANGPANPGAAPVDVANGSAETAAGAAAVPAPHVGETTAHRTGRPATVADPRTTGTRGGAGRVAASMTTSAAARNSARISTGRTSRDREP